MTIELANEEAVEIARRLAERSGKTLVETIGDALREKAAAEERERERKIAGYLAQHEEWRALHPEATGRKLSVEEFEAYLVEWRRENADLLARPITKADYDALYE